MTIPEDVASLAFDTREIEELKNGIPFVYNIDEENIHATVSLHLKGAAEYRVASPEQYALAYDPEGLMRRSLAAMLAPAVSGLRCRPEEVPEKLQASDVFAPGGEADQSFRRYAGAELVSLTVTECALREDDKAQVDRLLRMAELRDPGKAAERLIKAMEEAQAAAKGAAASVVHKTETWTCVCGSKNTGRFCPECGRGREWSCSCGQTNLGNFCTACGKKRS